MTTAAEGVYLRKDWGDSVTYGVPCDCGDDSHNHNVWVEADECGVSVTIYTQQKTKWYEQSRWAAVWTLLTKGYIEKEAVICLSGQQALNYAEALTSAGKKVTEFRKAKSVKN